MKRASLLQEISDQVEAALGNLSSPLNLSGDGVVHTGTTSLTIKCPDGVIVATDRQVSAGREIFERNYPKITRLSPFSVITYAGTVALIQMISELLGGFVVRFANRNGRHYPVQAQAHLLKNILLNITFRHRIYVASHFILAGYDPLAGPQVYTFDEIGGMYVKSEFFQSIGSGSSFAQGALHALSHAGQNKILSVADAIRAIAASGHFDLYTSDPSSAPPLIYTIKKSGIAEIDARTIGLTPDGVAGGEK